MTDGMTDGMTVGTTDVAKDWPGMNGMTGMNRMNGMVEIVLHSIIMRRME
jgi:hypothetical protein